MGVSAKAPSRRPTTADALQLGLIAALLAIAGLAWLVTDGRMEGMAMGPGGELGSLGFYITAWVVMMAAMMFPSIAPMVRTYALVLRRRRRRNGVVAPAPGIALFVAGYLVTWAAFGIAAYAVIGLVRALEVPVLAWNEAGRYLAGGVVLAAAVYQLTPLKDACLSRCRGPLDFLLERWREGLGGALRLGVEHGAWCVGCCWALMAALFALGVMNVAWMALVAAMIAVEKLLPWKRIANRGVAVVLVVLGLAVALTPASVPGLTVPDSEAAAMEAMNGDR